MTALLILLFLPLTTAQTLSNETYFITNNITYNFEDGYTFATYIYSGYDDPNLLPVDLNIEGNYIFNITTEENKCNITLITLTPTSVKWNITCPGTTDWVYHKIGNFSGKQDLYIDGLNNKTLTIFDNFVYFNYTGGFSTHTFELNLTIDSVDYNLPVLMSDTKAIVDLNQTYNFSINITSSGNITNFDLNFEDYYNETIYSNNTAHNITINITQSPQIEWINLTGKPAIEIGYTFEKSEVESGERYLYLGTLNVLDNSSKDIPIWYYVSKSRLTKWSEVKTVAYNINNSEFTNVTETDDFLIFKIPTTWGSSSLEKGNYEFKIVYYTNLGESGGYLPGGNGGLGSPSYSFQVDKTKIKLNINTTGTYIVPVIVKWSGPDNDIELDYSNSIKDIIISPTEKIPIENDPKEINFTILITPELVEKYAKKTIEGEIELSIKRGYQTYFQLIDVEIFWKKHVKLEQLPICGNGIIEEGEDIFRCPEDHGIKLPKYSIVTYAVMFIVIISSIIFIFGYLQKKSS